MDVAIFVDQHPRRAVVGPGGGAEGNSGPGKRAGPQLPGLKRARIRRNYTLARLAEISDIHSVTISRLENLKRGADPRTVYILAQALEVSEEELKGEQ